MSPLMTILAVVGIGLVVGLVFVPGIAFAFGKSFSMGALGRILFTIAQLTAGQSVLCKDGAGYNMRVVEDTDDGPAMYTDDGLVELNGESKWTRLGKSPFSVTWLKDGHTVDRYRVDEDPDVVGDGGTLQYFTDTRGGFPGFSPQPEDDEIQFRVAPLVNKLHGLGGTELVQDAKQKALEKFGGDDVISNKVLVAGSLGGLIVGSLMAFMMFGL